MVQLMTVDEAAAILSVERKWLLAQVKSGRISCFRIGPQTIRFSQENLDEFIAKGSRPMANVVEELPEWSQ